MSGVAHRGLYRFYAAWEGISRNLPNKVVENVNLLRALAGRPVGGVDCDTAHELIEQGAVEPLDAGVPAHQSKEIADAEDFALGLAEALLQGRNLPFELRLFLLIAFGQE